jgi:outer membrane receptor protein involved in Fe transport
MLPSLIDNVAFEKGPYRLDKGNFNTSGWVDFNLKKRLSRNELMASYGSFNTIELNGAVQVLSTQNHSAYVAGAWNTSDGYFESKQNFKRGNLYVAYTGKLDNSTILGVNLLHFQSDWTASGQIPERLVSDGSISRFGAVDDTEGGQVGRQQIQVNYTKFFKDRSSIKINTFAAHSTFELYSNFTFFLRDSLNGDQIRQKEDRITTGLKADYKKEWKRGKHLSTSLLAGLGFRNDAVNDLELSYTKNRSTTLEQVQLGDVDETNYFGYVGGLLSSTRWAVYGGVRYEQITHAYADHLSPTFSQQSATKWALLPKLRIAYNAFENLKLYAMTGIGTHSNDSRTTLGSTSDGNLPRAYSVDAGMEYKPTAGLLINLGFWHMRSEQEFVYVGDEGIVENNGRSKRYGVDIGLTWQPTRPLMFNANVNYTYARTDDAAESFIPLSAPLTASFSARYRFGEYFVATWYVQYLADRPADEFSEVVAEGYVLNHIKLAYERPRWALQLQVNNLFNTEWKEAQFLTESRLSSESTSTSEIHFTPGAPLNAKLGFQFFF